MTTEEKNSLIAEFKHGKKLKPNLRPEWEGTYVIDYIGTLDQVLMPEDIAYDKDWNLLMPVVEKIEKMDTPDERVFVEIKGGEVFIAVESPRKSGFLFLYQENGYDENDSKLGAVYKAVTAFIQWYNQNK